MCVFLVWFLNHYMFVGSRSEHRSRFFIRFPGLQSFYHFFRMQEISIYVDAPILLSCKDSIKCPSCLVKILSNVLLQLPFKSLSNVKCPSKGSFKFPFKFCVPFKFPFEVPLEVVYLSKFPFKVPLEVPCLSKFPLKFL